MQQPKTAQVSKQSTPVVAILALAFIFILGLFVVGFDQGHIFSVFQGDLAFDQMYLHELSHDVRHAAGFPCH